MAAEEHLQEVNRLANYHRQRHETVLALHEIVSASDVFTQREKRALFGVAEKAKKEHDRISKRLTTGRTLYETKVQSMQETLETRARIIDSACETLPQLVEHMDACQVFVEHHNELASGIQRAMSVIMDK